MELHVISCRRLLSLRVHRCSHIQTYAHTYMYTHKKNTHSQKVNLSDPFLINSRQEQTQQPSQVQNIKGQRWHILFEAAVFKSMPYQSHQICEELYTCYNSIHQQGHRWNYEGQANKINLSWSCLSTLAVEEAWPWCITVAPSQVQVGSNCPSGVESI